MSTHTKHLKIALFIHIDQNLSLKVYLYIMCINLKV